MVQRVQRVLCYVCTIVLQQKTEININSKHFNNHKAYNTNFYCTLEKYRPRDNFKEIKVM